MIVSSFRFVDLETPVEYFNTWLTPVPHFFVRNHMHEPSELNRRSWRLTVGGEVEKPFTLTLAELSSSKTHSVVNTLECAGNGRSLHPSAGSRHSVGQRARSAPRASRVRACATFCNAPELSPRASTSCFTDSTRFRAKFRPFIRSIPIEKALDSDTLVATHMNGAPLTKHHGFPARALVPGWIGAASCKWLTEIRVLDAEFVGNFMSPGYRLPNQPVKPGDAVKPEDTHPLTALSVKSVIPGLSMAPVSRRPESRCTARRGRARPTSSRSRFPRTAARIGTQLCLATIRRTMPGAYGATSGRPKSGDYTILSRATDSQGRTQPADSLMESKRLSVQCCRSGEDPCGIDSKLNRLEESRVVASATMVARRSCGRRNDVRVTLGGCAEAHRRSACRASCRPRRRLRASSVMKRASSCSSD